MNHKIYHTIQYKNFIEEAFDCKYELITATQNGTIKTILPIVKIKSKLFGNKIISSPYLEYGGFAGELQNIPKILDDLTKKYSKDYDYLEIRGGSEMIPSGMVKADLYKRFVLRLDSEEQVWNQIQKSKRKAIKKALKNIEVKEIIDLNELYTLYCKNMKQFLSPPYSKKYFQSFQKHLVKAGLGKMYGAYYKNRLIAALLGFTFKDRVHILIAVSDQKFQEYRGNDAVHWTFIKWACENNFKYFDFGRVREESGQYEYKRKWGPELQELPSYFLLWKTKEIPFVDPSSPKYRLFLKAWKLLPLSLTKLIGMPIRKRLGI